MSVPTPTTGVLPSITSSYSPLPAFSSNIGNGIVNPPANAATPSFLSNIPSNEIPFLSNVPSNNPPSLRALPPLPHPALISDISPLLTIDIRRRFEQLSRLVKTLEASGLGDHAPKPPTSSTSLPPLPSIPLPPTRTVKDGPTASQSLHARVQHRPPISGRYGTAADSESGEEGGHSERAEAGAGSGQDNSGAMDGEDGTADPADHRDRPSRSRKNSTLAIQRLVDRFNSAQTKSESGEPICSLKLQPQRAAHPSSSKGWETGHVLLSATWSSKARPGSEDLDEAGPSKAKRRKTDESEGSNRRKQSDLHAWIQLDSDMSVRETKIVRRPPSSSSSSSSSTFIPGPSSLPRPGPDSLLSLLLSRLHHPQPQPHSRPRPRHERLTILELLDRLPHVPGIISQPCVFCQMYLRPPDGLPLHGLGYLPSASTGPGTGAGARKGRRGSRIPRKSSSANGATNGNENGTGKGDPVQGDSTDDTGAGDGVLKADRDDGDGDKESLGGIRTSDVRIEDQATVTATAQSGDTPEALHANAEKGVSPSHREMGKWVVWHASCET